MSQRTKWIAVLGVMSLPFLLFAGWMIAVGAYMFALGFLALLALGFLVFAGLGLRHLDELDQSQQGGRRSDAPEDPTMTWPRHWIPVGIGVPTEQIWKVPPQPDLAAEAMKIARYRPPTRGPTRAVTECGTFDRWPSGQ
jgi:hypothetical protein